MAEEEKKAEGAEGEGEKKGGGLKAILIPVIASAVTSAIVGVIMIMLLAPKPAPVDGEEGEEGGEAAHGAAPAAEGGHGAPSGGHGGGHGAKEEKPAHAGVYHNFDPFVVTIFDHEKVHYLKTTVSLELSNEAVKEEIQAKEAQIKDSLLFVLGDFTLRELLDNQAKLLLKDTLVKTLNKIVGKDKILNVYFLEYTIQ